MKAAAVFSNNPEHRGAVDYFQEIESVIDISSLEELDKFPKVKGLLLERNNLTSPDLLTFREKHPKIKVILILDEEKDELFRRACITHDIMPLSHETPAEIIRQIIEKDWLEIETASEYENIIAIHGTHRQVGVTEISLGIAKVMRELNRNVVVVGLNPYNPGEIPTIETKYSLDYVYSLFQNGIPTDIETLKSYMIEMDGFHYLVGNRDYYRAPEFEKAPIEDLVESLRNHFDVIILDLGSFYDNFLPIAGLRIADTHLLVAAQEDLSIREYNRWKKQFLIGLDIQPKNQHLIVNKYASQAVVTPKKLQDELGVELLCQIPYFPEANDAQIEDGYLANSDYRPYVKSIIGLTKALLNEVGTPSETKKRNGFRSFLNKVGVS